LSVIISESSIEGTIQAPPSKSYTHRAIICSMLASGQSTIKNPLICGDTNSTLRLATMMGARIKHNQNLTVTGADPLVSPNTEMNCQGSGTTLRLFTAISALTNGKCILTGDSTLQKRPIGELLQALNQLGVKAISQRESDRPPVEIHGQEIEGARVRIRGDISSQYISGLLFACSKATSESTLEITTPLESRPYVEMTLEVMQHFGATGTPSDNWDTIKIPGDQEYHNSNYEVPGDYSSAAFLMVAGAISGKVKIEGLQEECLQGDSRIVEILKEMDVSITQERSALTVTKSEPVPISIDATHIPDLIPVLSVLASQAEGQTRIFNARRLRYKESNRLKSTTMELKKLGVNLEETSDGILINGPTKLRGVVIDPHSDHRIAMACAVVCLVSKHSVTINNIECVKKSYPNFIDDLISLGAKIEFSSVMSERRNAM